MRAGLSYGAVYVHSHADATAVYDIGLLEAGKG